MKRLLVLTILVLGRTLLPHVAINAQTYYNFAFAEATNNSGKGLIRAVDRATAVSYYQKSNGDQALLSFLYSRLPLLMKSLLTPMFNL